EGAGTRQALLGIDIVVVDGAMAGFLENLRGLGRILHHAGAVTIGAAVVHATGEVRWRAARSLAAAAIELDRALLVLGHPFAVVVCVAEVCAGGRAAAAAALVVGGDSASHVDLHAASPLVHQADVVAAVRVAEVAGADEERRGADVVAANHGAGRVEGRQGPATRGAA